MSFLRVQISELGHDIWPYLSAMTSKGQVTPSTSESKIDSKTNSAQGQENKAEPELEGEVSISEPWCVGLITSIF